MIFPDVEIVELVRDPEGNVPVVPCRFSVNGTELAVCSHDGVQIGRLDGNSLARVTVTLIARSVVIGARRRSEAVDLWA